MLSTQEADMPIPSLLVSVVVTVVIALLLARCYYSYQHLDIRGPLTVFIFLACWAFTLHVVHGVYVALGSNHADVHKLAQVLYLTSILCGIAVLCAGLIDRLREPSRQKTGKTTPR